MVSTVAEPWRMFDCLSWMWNGSVIDCLIECFTISCLIIDGLFDCITTYGEGGERSGIWQVIKIFEFRDGINERASTLERLLINQVLLSHMRNDIILLITKLRGGWFLCAFRISASGD
jgi:hypothetical protein